MEKDYNKIAHYWKSTYSSKVKQSQKFDIPRHFKKMAGLMAPGKSYFYIANFHTLELELISDSVKDFTGHQPEEVDLTMLLSLALPEEIESLQNKEKLIKTFMIDFLCKSEMLDYKVMYTYKLKDYKGEKRVMLHQASILSMTPDNNFVHVFSIHTDISHLARCSTEDVSFINVNGGKDYLNVCSRKGTFDPDKLIAEPDIKNKLSEREIEIVRKMSHGLSSEEIAKDLCISPFTVRTHRKNILKKTHSKNSSQLIANCIATGIVSPAL